jgi:hypothetical protein
MRQKYIDTRETERFAAYAANEAFYQGDSSAQLTLLSTPKRDEVRAVFNYARDILNKHAAATVNGLACRVIGEGERLGVPSLGSGGEGVKAQQELDDAFRNSSAFSTDFTVALNAGVLGDGAFYVSHLDGQVFYRALHPGDVEVLEWRADCQPARVMLQHDDRIETWTTETVTIEGAGAEMSDFLEKSDISSYRNPYGLLPVVVFPNWPRPGSRWGDSTLEHIKAACRLLNERIDLLMWLVRVQGNPPIKTLGVETATLRTDPGEIWSAPAGAQLELVKLLDAETAGIHIETVNLLLQIVKELSNTPSVAYGIGNTELSGRALELSYMPMTQAANIRRGFFGEAVRRRNRIILRMAEVLHSVNLAGCYDTEVTFAPVIPLSLTPSPSQH